MIIILPRDEWPEDLQHPEVRGIAIGSCGPERKRIRNNAHAHCHGEHRGWICFRNEIIFGHRHIRLHELAHIVTREGHTKRFREYLLQIGGTIDGRAIASTLIRDDGTVHVTYASGSVTTYPPGSPGAVKRSGKPAEFYKCETCSAYHPVIWDGDCRDDYNRHFADELDSRYGPKGWRKVERP